MSKKTQMSSRELAMSAALVLLIGMALSVVVSLFIGSPFKELLSGLLTCITFTTMGYIGGIRAERYKP